MVQLNGYKVKCVSTDGSDIDKLTLYNELELGEEEIAIGVNDSSKIIFIFSTDLFADEYRLEIKIYFTTGTTLLKEPRILVYPIKLKVS